MSVSKSPTIRGSVVLSLLLVAAVSLADDRALITGQNINMVSGTEWPDGDPFLQRQNEGSLALSTRDALTILAGSNDYRTVDLPGLPDEKAIGDSWPSVYRSFDGGGRWVSNLMPGYPQDTSAFGTASPLYGYDAGADPVVRAGTHGLFYYSGIVFNRGDSPPSAGFVTTYVDLNNDETGDSIGIVRTTLYDENTTGTFFIDKPWIETDVPRPGAQVRTLDVITSDGSIVQQTVECGNLYAVWARIEGDGTIAVSSQIMFAVSTDCGETFSVPQVLSSPDTINQGAMVAVDPVSGRVQVVWRQFENATLNCTRLARFWRRNPEDWPVDELEIGGYLVKQTSGGRIIVQLNDDEDNMDPVSHEDEGEYDSDRPNRLFRQLLATWLNLLAGADGSDIEHTIADAEAWLDANPLGTRPSFWQRVYGRILKRKLRRFNFGITGPGRCDALDAGGLSGTSPNAIMVVSSSDAGATFTAPQPITDATYYPFEQGTTEFSFRTTGFPSMVFDGTGRSYVAYASRGYASSNPNPVGGDSRIVVTTSQDGATWTLPQPIDVSERDGHQIQPALAAHRGYVFALYYDFREDISGVFDRFIVDLPVDPSIPRHSTDVRVAQALAADVPEFTDYSVLDLNPSSQASRYPFLLLNDENGDPQSVQLLYNPPNLPMFKGGTVPFFGDYLDIAGLRYFLDDTGVWQYDLDPSRGTAQLHAMWTDNRDVVGPIDGDWTSYVPPGDGTSPPSLFDPSQSRAACDPMADPTVFDRTKMRNQNVYTASITQGLKLSIPGNNRELDLSSQRAFVAFIQNTTDNDKAFRLEFISQPVGGTASFEQFSFLDTVDEVVERQSSTSTTIYVTSSDPSASVTVRATEIDEFGAIVPNGLTALAIINSDPSAPVPDPGNLIENYSPAVFNPAVFNSTIFDPALLGTDPNVGIYNPAVFNPAVFNSAEDPEFIKTALAQQAYLNPAVFNPAVFNPAVFNLAVFNPAVFNPAVFNPAVFNPAVFNPAVFNVSTANPAVFNPAVFNPAVFNGSVVETVETSVVVKNEGDTTAAYSLNLDLDNPPSGFVFQIMVYKTYTVPAVEGCQITENVVQQPLVSELNPDVDGSLLDPESTSFFVAPGDNVIVSVRVIPDDDPGTPSDPDTIDTLPEINLSQSIVPQAVDTVSATNGETEPTPVVVLAPSVPPLVVSTTSLANGQAGTPYAATLTATGGDGSPVTWELVPGDSLPTGLILDGVSGVISGTPSVPGTTAFAVRAKDDDQVAEQVLSLTIDPGVAIGTTIRADFDFSGSIINAGPYACLRTFWSFSPPPPASGSISVNLFDDEFAASSGSTTTPFSAGISSIAYETFVPGLGFADGVGHVIATLPASAVANLSSLQIQAKGAGGSFCGAGDSGFAVAKVCTFDEENYVDPNGAVSVPGLAPVGQTFTASGSSMNAVALWLNLPSGGPSGTVAVRLRADSITGTILGTTPSQTVTNIAAPELRYLFEFATPIALTPGNTYAIEVVHSAGQPVGVWGQPSNTYSGGSAVTGGTLQPGSDRTFQQGVCLP